MRALEVAAALEVLADAGGEVGEWVARDGVLAGHGKRVLYLALSPDSRVAVTGAGDESLRFWACFGRRRSGPGGLLECGGIR